MSGELPKQWLLPKKLWINLCNKVKNTNQVGKALSQRGMITVKTNKKKEWSRVLTAEVSLGQPSSGARSPRLAIDWR